MPARLSLGQHPPPSHVIVHLSDPHLLAGGLLNGRVDVDAGLARAIAAIEHAEPHPDAIVITGDLADLGEPEAYRRLKAAFAPIAERTPVIWVAGNHDERPALRAELLEIEGTQEPVTGVWDLNGLRLIVLDTSVPGWHHGALDDHQLEWLAVQLERVAPHGTLLALHHPPIPSHVPLFGILELQNAERLAAIIADTDVRGILAGHLHYSSHGTFAGVPVSVASATCYTMNLALAPTAVNGMDAAQSFRLVHVYPDTITHTVVPVTEAETATIFTHEWAMQMAALTPQERQEAFSRKRERGLG